MEDRFISLNNSLALQPKQTDNINGLPDLTYLLRSIPNLEAANEVKLRLPCIEVSDAVL